MAWSRGDSTTVVCDACPAAQWEERPEALFSERSGGLLGLILSSVLQFETAALGLSPMAFLGLLSLTALSRPLSSCEMPC